MSIKARSEILAFAHQQGGKIKTVSIPRIFVDLFDGDMNAAALLNQILYWMERSTDAQGWFYKSYTDWQSELGLSEYQVKRALNGDKRSKSKSRTLKAVGVETQLKHAPNGAPTLHYRVRLDTLKTNIVHYLQCEVSIPNIAQNGNQTLSGMDTEQCSGSYYTESTTEITSKSTAAKAAHTRTREEAPPETAAALGSKTAEIVEPAPETARISPSGNEAQTTTPSQDPQTPSSAAPLSPTPEGESDVQRVVGAAIQWLGRPLGGLEGELVVDDLKRYSADFILNTIAYQCEREAAGKPKGKHYKYLGPILDERAAKPARILPMTAAPATPLQPASHLPPIDVEAFFKRNGIKHHAINP